jgi:[ribosomal protein S5]-alanine N-acetyltransferase
MVGEVGASMPSSDRLTYRPASTEDVEMLRAHWNRAEVRRYLWDDEEVTVERVEAAVRRGLDSRSAFGGGLCCLFVDHAFVGTCGLLPVFPELDSLLTDALDPALLQRVGDAPLVEVLYSLEPAEWGKGYALEAAQALLRHGHGSLGLAVILGGTDTPNVRSAVVLRRAGMIETVRFEGDVGPLVYFASVSVDG